MDKLNKVISTAKKLINLSYCNFNLENYFKILYKTFGELGFRGIVLNERVAGELEAPEDILSIGVFNADDIEIIDTETEF